MELQHANKFAQRILDNPRCFDFYEDARTMIAKVDAAAEAAIGIHEELKELRRAFAEREVAQEGTE
jgi:hypothetical protein